MPIEIKGILCPQCGGTDIQMESERRGMCNVCGSHFLIYCHSHKDDPDLELTDVIKSRIHVEFSKQEFLRKAWIRLENSVDNSAEIEIISSSVYGASTSSQTSETSTSILSEPTEFSTTESSMSSMLFHVRSNWNDPASEIGAWQSIDDAISACSEGYYVFDDGGNIVFAPSNNETSSEATTEPIIIQFQNVLAEAHTHHTVNYNYVNNVTLACAAIDGTIVMPGEEFSFNKAVGVQTVEKGYREALVYTGGQSKPEVGGGVCQVASTLYYAVLQADLETTERAEHMFLVDYVPFGMDATVHWGSLDYKFRNNSPYPIKIESSVHDGQVHVILYGTKWKDYTVELNYMILNTDNWVTVEKDVPDDGTYYNGEVITTPITGYKVRTYKTTKNKKTGEEETTVIADSEYKKRDKVIARIVAKPTEPPTEPTQPTAPPEPTEPNLSPTITEIVLNHDDISFFNAGESFTLTVINIPADISVEWKSLDTSIATVDENGHVVAVGKGTTQIYATVYSSSQQLETCCWVRCVFGE